MAKVGELIKIFWEDAHGSAANVTYSIEELPHAPILVESYGILLKQDETGVSIASEKCDKDCWRGYSFIPAKMILKVEPVKKPRRKKSPPVEVTP